MKLPEVPGRELVLGPTKFALEQIVRLATTAHAYLELNEPTARPEVRQDPEDAVICYSLALADGSVLGICAHNARAVTFSDNDTCNYLEVTYPNGEGEEITGRWYGRHEVIRSLPAEARIVLDNASPEIQEEYIAWSKAGFQQEYATVKPNIVLQ